MSAFMSPLDAIEQDPPNVWLTSGYGFDPEDWGCLGFTNEQALNSFLKRSHPGVLVVHYGTGKAAKAERGLVLGILQCSHNTGPIEHFLSPYAWAKKQCDADRRDRWNLAVEAVRAWRVVEEHRIDVKNFAPQTWAPGRARAIGNIGMPLTAEEARRLLNLPLVETDVAHQTSRIGAAIGFGSEVLSPSRAGPVSQSSYVLREAEGPKHLYILRLDGDTDAFLGEPAAGAQIFKVGMSGSPATRCRDFNAALPKGAFKWKLFLSTHLESHGAAPSSQPAIKGEDAMKSLLMRQGRSLGREFFLAEDSAIEQAWTAGVSAMREASA